MGEEYGISQAKAYLDATYTVWYPILQGPGYEDLVYKKRKICEIKTIGINLHKFDRVPLFVLFINEAKQWFTSNDSPTYFVKHVL